MKHFGDERSGDWQVRALPLLTWIEQGGMLEANIEASAFACEMPRLYQVSAHPPRQALSWRASGLTETRSDQNPHDMRERRHWLRLEANAQLILTCQRCMHPLTVDLHIKRRFLVAIDEASADRLEDAAQDDYDVIAHEQRFDLLALTEDELLLALPIVPKHRECDPPGLLPSEESESFDRPRPFAVLAQLKRDKLRD